MSSHFTRTNNHLINRANVSCCDLQCDRSTVYPLVIAAHPSEPNQLALGLSDGGVQVIEPLEAEGKWGTGPPSDNGTVGCVQSGPASGNQGSDQTPR